MAPQQHVKKSYAKGSLSVIPPPVVVSWGFLIIAFLSVLRLACARSVAVDRPFRPRLSTKSTLTLKWWRKACLRVRESRSAESTTENCNDEACFSD